MAVVRGIREKVHLPLYDAKTFSRCDHDGIAEQISTSGNMLRFFVDVQNKTKLETNQQESSVLSHYNTYEARAIRVVVEPPPLADSPVSNTDFLFKFIYNSVTTFVVGEKIMIQAPTWFFPAGAGPSNESGLTNGWPSPAATFRLGEPVVISHQQNFRVEIEFPRGAVDALGPKVMGPAKVWVLLDGYITRDVQ